MFSKLFAIEFAFAITSSVVSEVRYPDSIDNDKAC